MSMLLGVPFLLELFLELSHFLGQIGDLTGLSATWLFPGLLCGIEGLNQTCLFGDLSFSNLRHSAVS